MAENREEVLGWLRLNGVSGLGPVICSRLLEAFGSPARIFAAKEKELLEVEGVGRVLASSILDSRGLESAREVHEKCAEMGIKIMCRRDSEYPDSLAELPDAPVVLFMRGSYEPPDRLAVAMVGCRNPDPYGESMAVSLAAGLARHGVTLVSGMARGIDGIAQRAALKAGGRSIAVLGTGADVAYPSENRDLYESLIGSGAVISEFPPGVQPAPENFPRRNRIISGLSKGVVMVQAMSKKSGALITVRHALEQGSRVYAVPGNVGSRSGRVGNDLIKQGATLVESAEDVLLDIQPLGTISISAEEGTPSGEAEPGPVLPDHQARLYALVPAPAEGSIDADALARQAGLTPGQAMATLLELELSGMIKTLPGKRYVRLIQG